MAAKATNLFSAGDMSLSYGLFPQRWAALFTNQVKFNEITYLATVVDKNAIANDSPYRYGIKVVSPKQRVKVIGM